MYGKNTVPQRLANQGSLPRSNTQRSQFDYRRFRLKCNKRWIHCREKQLETQLSIRMPKAFDRYYFIIDDQNHPSFSSFDCLTPDKLGLLLEETNFLLPMHSLILNTPNGSRSIRQPLEHWKSREKLPLPALRSSALLSLFTTRLFRF